MKYRLSPLLKTDLSALLPPLPRCVGRLHLQAPKQIIGVMSEYAAKVSSWSAVLNFA